MPAAIASSPKKRLLTGVFAGLETVFDHPVLSRYYRAVREAHGSIKFLGLPSLRDTGRDVPLDRLYVEPGLSSRRISPEEMDNAKTLPVIFPALTVLSATRIAVVLGDPGSGKSTLVNWLCESLSSPTPSAVVATLGRLIPLPFILRDLGIDSRITWPGLLAAFLKKPVAAALAENPALLEDILANGQACILLDGIDEIASVEVRRCLRAAVQEGMWQYPNCRWLLTSRIVGYDEVPFGVDSDVEDLEKEMSKRKMPMEGAFLRLKLKADEFAKGLAPLYVAPFDRNQIVEFAGNWYGWHEANPRDARENATSFVAAVEASPGTRALGRIPNLLTLMALIYRVFSQLPHGRTLLYDKISEAYLESIDTYRKVPSACLHSRQEKERWLGAIAFQMQISRSEAAQKEIERVKRNAFDWQSSGEILIPEKKLLDLLTALIADKTGAATAKEEARVFLDSIQRRSGLLLDRGEGLYGFTHLSFQEYFAARHLRQIILSRSWQRENAGTRPKDRSLESLFRLRQYATRQVWQETFIYLFESLTSDSDWPDELATMLELAGERGKLKDEAWAARTTLAAALSVNPHIGFTHACRQRLWRNCLQVSMEERHWLEYEPFRPISRQLFSSTQYASQLGELLRIITGEKQPRHICLDSLADLSPLAGLGSLQELSLSDCAPLTDLSPLAGLSLLTLTLRNCTALSDLSPLAGLGSLQELSLSDCAPLTDLSPLAGLGSLQRLGLFGCTALTDLSPLAGLGSLQTLALYGCTALSDLSPLAGLDSLQTLYLHDCTALTDLSPVEHVPERYGP